MCKIGIFWRNISFKVCINIKKLRSAISGILILSLTKSRIFFIAELYLSRYLSIYGRCIVKVLMKILARLILCNSYFFWSKFTTICIYSQGKTKEVAIENSNFFSINQFVQSGSLLQQGYLQKEKKIHV